MVSKKYKGNSDILQAVHESVRGLHGHGFITKKRMAHYDALCLDPVPEYTGESIKSLRRRLKISQAVLAGIINISVSTVQQWEAGNKKPGGPSAKLLSLLDRKGIEALV